LTGRPIWVTPSETRKQYTGGIGARFPKFVLCRRDYISRTSEGHGPHAVRELQIVGTRPMRSIAFADFLIGVGILFVIEGLMFAASPAWMRRAMKSALATPDNILRAVGIGSAVAGLILIWVVRHRIW
jgi:uncharacterized protein YjeT (DUF2065 family)